MAEAVSISSDEIKQLGIKLMGLQHKLTPNERTILWAALAVAVDAVSSTNPGLGTTTLVKGPANDQSVLVEVEDTEVWRDATDLRPDFPDLLAQAFQPETQAPDAVEDDEPPAAGGHPAALDNRGKIGGLVGWNPPPPPPPNP